MVDLSIANWDSLQRVCFSISIIVHPPSFIQLFEDVPRHMPGSEHRDRHSFVLCGILLLSCFFLLCYTYTLLYYSLLCHLYIYGFVSRLKIGYAQRKCWLTDGFWAPQVAKQKENIVEWKVPGPYFGVPMIPNGWLVFAGKGLTLTR